MPDQNNHIAIIGTGPVGLITALACATILHRNNKSATPQISLLGPKPDDAQLQHDTRTTAFMQPSLNILANLGILDQCSHNAAPLRHLRMIDDCGNLLRAPDCHFSAQELGFESFAQNIPNKDLNRALITAIESARSPGAPINWIETSQVTSVSNTDNSVTIETAEGDIYNAAFVIGADGRNSISRAAAGITATSWQYDQTALACSFTHRAPHNATSIELHRPAGPLTLIPLQAHPERREFHASLVWSLAPDDAQEMLSIDEDAFCRALFEASHGLYGEIINVGKRVAFPISGLKLDKLAANRIALVGEAAHVVPPIGAQGMNMGLADVAHLVEALSAAITDDPAPFADTTALEQAYNDARLKDVQQRTTAIDILNKSLLLSFLPLQAGRTLGLTLLNRFKPLRRFVMQSGLGRPVNASSLSGNDTALPALMRPAAGSSTDHAA